MPKSMLDVEQTFDANFVMWLPRSLMVRNDLLPTRSIPVRLHIDTVPPGVMLAAGMTCSVSIGDEGPKGRLLSMLDALR